ncbi:MAG: helix-turn-helix transcriptional regulator [Reichenbachiella sp.]|uniref:helix-turn-helix transcriptional regulator n=1 Tax=Reichenbachiella sp. TaxID=2184521 RepID=UPI003266AD94
MNLPNLSPEKTTSTLAFTDTFNQHKINRFRRQESFRKENLNRFLNLTKREVEVLSLVVNDYNNPQIATHLFISRKTVEQHRKNIYRKLRINTIPQLFQYALAFDLI